MKIFLDTAITDDVSKHFKTGLIDGLTTNPTLIRKSGKNHEEVYQEIKNIGVTDISMEVIGNAENMISEGKRLHKKFGKVATIKVPCTVDGLLACKELSDNGIISNNFPNFLLLKSPSNPQTYTLFLCILTSIFIISYKSSKNCPSFIKNTSYVSTICNVSFKFFT